MADGLTYDLQGMDVLLGKLKTLEQEPRKKTTRFALRKAANFVRDDAKQRASRFDDPQTPSNIPDSIVVKADTKHTRRTGDLKMSVGVKGGAKTGGTYHWRFLEFGTEHMAAQPFMRPALEQNIGAASNEFANQFEKAIIRAIKRANKAKR